MTPSNGFEWRKCRDCDFLFRRVRAVTCPACRWRNYARKKNKSLTEKERTHMKDHPPILALI